MSEGAPFTAKHITPGKAGLLVDARVSRPSEKFQLALTILDTGSGFLRRRGLRTKDVDFDNLVLKVLGKGLVNN
jgi:hypothetical protein